jgi:inorganic pyrophosphatase/exopolyphosphatase
MFFRLALQQEAYADVVVEILDHHLDETSNKYPNLKRKEIHTVGSCCTLVAERVNYFQ